MGTLARLAASAAVRISKPSVASMTQGKNWMMRGERAVSAAWTRPSTYSILCAMAPMTDDTIATGFCVVKNTLMAIGLFSGHFGGERFCRG